MSEGNTYILTNSTDLSVYKMVPRELRPTPLAPFINNDKSSLEVDMTSMEVLVGAFLSILPDTSKDFDSLLAKLSEKENG